MSIGKQIAATLLGLIVAAAVVVGLYFGYWALLAKNAANNRYQVNTNTQQYQAGLIAQEEDRVTAYNVATDDAQKTLIRNQFCTTYLNLTQPPADLVQAHAAICG